MSLSNSPDLSPPSSARDTSVLADRQLSPTPSSTSPTFPEHSVSEAGIQASQDPRDDAVSSKADSATSSRLKKKFNDLDIRGAMADLDLRKGGKRTGIEDFYIQLDEPHRMYWCPGEVVRGVCLRLSVANPSGQVHLSLDRPVKTQFVMLKLTGLLSVSMVRDKVEYVIFEEELLLWGTKIHATSYDRTYSREDTTMEYDTPKKQKEEWETGIMDEGEHPFPFEFDLPAKSMPSSIDVSLQEIVSKSSLARDRSLTRFIVFTSDRPHS
jgi:Arrestin (or S-antigen), N-terminal domain